MIRLRVKFESKLFKTYDALSIKDACFKQFCYFSNKFKTILKKSASDLTPNNVTLSNNMFNTHVKSHILRLVHFVSDELN